MDRRPLDEGGKPAGPRTGKLLPVESWELRTSENQMQNDKTTTGLLTLTFDAKFSSGATSSSGSGSQNTWGIAAAVV